MLAKVGQPAPSFTLPSTKGATSPKNLGQEISLSDYQGKWLILFFYPLDFTFVCPTEIIALSDRLDEFAELDTEVLGASTDSVHSHFAWLNTPREKNGIAGTAYPLAADYTKEVSRAYGVLDEATGVAQRGLFIIDPEGILRYAVVTADNVGRSVEETLRVLQALQTGGLCPAEWTPGQELLTVGSVAAMPLRTGSTLPALGGAAAWINGEPAAEELAGKPVLVHFWSVSCHICHDVAAEVAAVARRVRPARAGRDRRPPAARPRGARRRRGDGRRARADGDHLAVRGRQLARDREAFRKPVRPGVLRVRRRRQAGPPASGRPRLRTPPRQNRRVAGGARGGVAGLAHALRIAYTLGVADSAVSRIRKPRARVAELVDALA